MRVGMVVTVALVNLVASLVNLVWETVHYDFPPDMDPQAEDLRQVGDSPTNLTWFIHITDLHISKFYAPERTAGFLRLTEEILRTVQPAAVVVTGDLTDAKTADYSGSRQYMDEWADYHTAVQLARNRTLWLDIRGNHDNFDVSAPGDQNNYFKEFSSQGQEGNLGSYLKIMRHNGVRLAFLALDATLKPAGPRRPFNFVGALNQHDLGLLKGLARKAKDVADGTVWFGHYPTSTIVAPLPGHREVMEDGLVYLCGHLHNIHGLAGTMVVRHRSGLREAELTDWKDNRMFRLMAMDQGVLSWRDVSGWAGLPLPLVLVTWPPAGPRAGDREPLHLLTTSTHIRLLVFARAQVVVRVGVDGGEPVVAQHAKDSLYTAPWRPRLYTKGPHTIQVLVEEAGKETHVETHHFSLDGSSESLPALGQLVLLVDFISLFQFFFILLVCIAIVPLTHLRLSAAPSFTPNSLLLLAHLPAFYWPLVLAPLYLTIGPWFVGELLTGSIGVVLVWGSFVQGVYIPTATTWLYGVYHLAIIHLPLLLATCLILHSRLTEDTQPWASHPYTRAIFRHTLMAALVMKQTYLVYCFHLSYGPLAVILGPYRTGHLLLSLYLWVSACTVTKCDLAVCLSDKYDKTF